MATVSKNAIRVMLIKNELGGDISKAYKISHAGNKGGYSYGQPQWDLAQRWKATKDGTKPDPGWDTFEEIVRAQISDRTIQDRIIDKVKNPSPTLTSEEINLINQALYSNYGKVIIDNAFDTHLDSKISRLNGLLGELSANGKTQIADYIENNPFMQMALIDYDNQLYIQGIDGTGETDGPLLRYFKGEKVALGYGKEVQIRGDFGLEDYLNFYLNTKEGQDKPSTLIRRFSNILEQEGINNISLTQEDINFLLSDLEELLGDRYKAILFNPDNWGIKNLISKAYALWADRSANFYGIDYWQRLQMNIVIPAQLQSFTAALAAIVPPRGDPLILDLDGDGTETTAVADGAYFDHDGNGFAERTGWAGLDDGLLVWDRNGDGVINNGRELFGDQTLLKNSTRATNGFQALAEWDENLDGKIDVNDSIWSNLRIWRDFDGDGYSSVGEFYALNELGIIALNTGYSNVNITDPNGNIQTQAGTFTKADGTAGQMNNYTLRRDMTYTIANEWLEVPSDIAGFPDLQAYGTSWNRFSLSGRGVMGLIRRVVVSILMLVNWGYWRSSLVRHLWESAVPIPM